jgi:hypothetical protein
MVQVYLAHIVVLGFLIVVATPSVSPVTSISKWTKYYFVLNVNVMREKIGNTQLGKILS